MNEVNEVGEVLSVKEVAELLNLTEEIVREYLREGIIPGRKLRKEWRILRSALMAALKPDNPA